MSAHAELIEAFAQLGSRVLLVGADAESAHRLAPGLRGDAIAARVGARDEVSLHDGLAGSAETRFDGGLIVGWGRALGPVAIASAVGARVEGGGRLGFFVPVKGQSFAGALVGALRRRRSIALEDLCEALLHAGTRDIRVPAAGRAGTLAWGRLPR